MSYTVSVGGLSAKRRRRFRLLAMAGLATTLCVPVSPLVSAEPLGRPIPPVSGDCADRPETALAALPVYFEANRGQASEDVGFIVRTTRYVGALAPDALALRADGGRSRVVMRLVGADPDATLRAGRPLPGRSHYLLGNDHSEWVRDVPHFADVRAEDVYPGIDVHWRPAPDARHVAYDFEIEPHADPAVVTLSFEGASDVVLGDSGELVTRTEAGEFRHAAPYAFQEIRGVRQSVRAAFRLLGGGRIGIDLGRYDRSQTLVIDPSLTYSSYLGGGSGLEQGLSIAVDDQGAVFVAGRVASTDMTTVSPFQDENTSSASLPNDGFVLKVNAAGTSLVFATYLGGSGNDHAHGIAVDDDGFPYVSGRTDSSDFPLESPIQSTLGSNGRDAFITKLEDDGSGLVYSTLFGGDASGSTSSAYGTFGRGIAVDGDGAAYMVGRTGATSALATSGAYQTTLGGGVNDAFIVKVNAAGSAFVYASYIGGAGWETATGVAVDDSGNAYVCGWTASSDFPTQNAYRSTYGGGAYDGYVVKLNASGSSMSYGTYLGGSGDDRAWSVALDAGGSAYVTGETTSTNFPTTVSAVQQTKSGGSDAFVTKLTSAGSSLSYSTYIGGSWDDVAFDIDATSNGIAVVAGMTKSSNFPTSAAAQSSYGGGSADAFVSMLSTTGSSYLYSTYLGGSGTEFPAGAVEGAGGGVALDASGRAYVTGATASTNFPTTGAFQISNGGGTSDGFVAKMPAPLPPGAPSALAATATSDRDIRLSWTDTDDFEDEFEIQRALGNGAFFDLDTASANSGAYTDSTAEASTTYRFRVRATNSVGASGWSGVASATTASPPPTDFAAAAVSSHSVTLTWVDDANDELGYVVERANGCPGTDWKVIAVLGPGSTSYTDTTAQPETEYSYRVRTRSAGMDSSPTLSVCVTTGPKAPSNLTATTRSDTEIVLRWNDESAAEAAYEIERDGPQGGPQTIAGVPGNTALYVDASVAPETAYEYRVRAVGTHLPSRWSPRVGTTTAPAAPSDPFGSMVSPSRLRVTWTDNSAVEQGYEIRRRIHGSKLPTQLAGRTAADAGGFVDEGLLQETAYDYTIRAFGSWGESRAVEVSELQTAAALVIRKVKTKAANRGKPTSLTVQADIDLGGYQPDAADGVTIRINGTPRTVGGVQAKKSGRVLSGQEEGITFKLSLKSATAGRGTLKLTVTGDIAAIDGDAELTVAFLTGRFAGAGSVLLSGGRFAVKKKQRVGARISPDVVPTKLRLRLSGLEKDRLTLAASFEPRAAVPDDLPDARITIGATRLTLGGARATVSGLKVTYALDTVRKVKLTVDYGKGSIKLSASKLELGDYEKGDVPTVLEIDIGELRWRDVPVLISRGKSAGF